MNNFTPTRRFRLRRFCLCLSILLTLSLLITFSISFFVTHQETAKLKGTQEPVESQVDTAVKWIQEHQAANGEWQINVHESEQMRSEENHHHVSVGLEWIREYQAPSGEWTFNSSDRFRIN